MVSPTKWGLLGLVLALVALAQSHPLGTQEDPIQDCAQLKNRPAYKSGQYWIQPAGVDSAYQGYCDLTSFGGGWLMCYTTLNTAHVSREISSTVAYGVDGYRSDCRHYPFNEVMYVDPAGSDKVWFKFRGYGSMVASHGNYGGNINASWTPADELTGHTWSAHGGANFKSKACRDAKELSGTASYSQATVLSECEAQLYYQLLICDDTGVEGDTSRHFGFAMHAKSDSCTSTCQDPCIEADMDWYRSQSGGVYWKGTAFKTPGAVYLPDRLLSVGIRYGHFCFLSADWASYSELPSYHTFVRADPSRSYTPPS